MPKCGRCGERVKPHYRIGQKIVCRHGAVRLADKMLGWETEVVSVHAVYHGGRRIGPEPVAIEGGLNQ